MEGTVNISEFVSYLKRNDLVIVPSHQVMPDTTALKDKCWRKKALTFKEIADAELWGSITQKRAYQIAMEFAKPGEVFVSSDSRKTKKIITTAVRRIAVQRGGI